MKTRNFFVETIDKGDESVLITGDELKHIRGVLRLKEGDHVTVFNGKGLALRGVIGRMDLKSATVRLLGESVEDREAGIHVTLIQAIVKGDKNDLIVQKAVELDVAKVILYPADRTVARLDKDRGADRLSRWLRIAIESAKQCGRTVVPDITLALGIKEAVSGHEGILKIMLWEGERTRTIKEVLRSNPSAKAVALLVGPEGGFSDEDTAIAVKNGFMPASLGRRILRAETAAITGLAIVQYELGGVK